MNWLTQLQSTQPVASAVLTLSLVAIAGLALGNAKIRGIGLGAAGVLFAGILFGHLGFEIERGTLGFVRDFGLILFVYTIGMQVGPGFGASLRREGFRMNVLAALIVGLGAALTVILGLVFKQDLAAMMGVFAGATTNTPALGAAQEALKSVGASPAATSAAGMGYAVAYPGGIAGLILVMILFRTFGRIDPEQEAARLKSEQEAARPRLTRSTLVVENPKIDGVALADLPGLRELGVTLSRVQPAGQSTVVSARPDLRLHPGDRVLAVGTRENLDRLRLIIGSDAPEDLSLVPGDVTTRRVVVTQREVLGQSVEQLALPTRYGVTLTRLSRGEVELAAAPDLRLQFGDIAQVVGRDEDLRRAEKHLGNSARALNQTNFLAIFVGIALGVMVGLYPVSLPGLPVPLRLGLAGGPLVVALIISRLGQIGPVIWHMPFNANLALRELGLTLFLACVGLSSGAHFAETLRSGAGFVWMGLGFLITVLPLLVVAWLGRRWARLPFPHLCGLLAGSLTDPPALAFATGMNRSDAPTFAYATVYPLTMLLRILVAQVLTLQLLGS
ncbi:MAG: putative transporter [Verrucomicrobiales bacterium]|nr:putative transporter [Verrucomicrobiales bacterium]